MTQIKNVVFEGGGVLGTAYVGCIEELDNYIDLKGLRKFAGSSIGAGFAAILAAGADAAYVRKAFAEINLRDFEDESWGILGGIWRFIREYGYCRGDKLTEWFRDHFKTLLGNPNITFKGLKDLTGRELIVTGTNLTLGRTIYFNVEEYPNMEIALAVRISSSFPFLFSAPDFDHSTWTDGGVLNNYPMNIFSAAEPGETIGFKLVSDSEITPRPKPIGNIREFAIGILQALHTQAGKINNEDPHQTINIPTGDIASTDFDLDPKQRKWLIEQGRAAVEKYFDRLPGDSWYRFAKKNLSGEKSDETNPAVEI